MGFKLHELKVNWNRLHSLVNDMADSRHRQEDLTCTGNGSGDRSGNLAEAVHDATKADLEALPKIVPERCIVIGLQGIEAKQLNAGPNFQ